MKEIVAVGAALIILSVSQLATSADFQTAVTHCAIIFLANAISIGFNGGFPVNIACLVDVCNLRDITMPAGSQ